MSKKGLIITFSVLASVMLAGGAVWGGISLNNTMNALGEYKMQLEYVYERNFYELTDNVNNIEANLAKLKVSTDSKLQERYLASLVALSNTAQNNIAVLPLEHQAISDTITFVNQLSGYSLVLQQNLVKGKSLTNDDFYQIADLHESSKSIKYELNRLSNLIASDYSIVDNASNPNSENNNFSNEFSGLNNEIVDYPQLIYDGPFSESTTNKEIKGLSATEINSEQALAKLKKWFADYEITLSSETNGSNFDTFNFSLEKNNQKFYAQVTKRDGILLALNGDADSSSKQNKTESECRTIAQNFATMLEFEDLQAVWSTSIEGFCYINLTPVINDVIIYPDLIKVKIDMSSGQVIGWEAKSWAYNHTQRNNLSARIDEIEARKSVTSDMDIRTTKLAIIPNEYVGETLTYEFMCVADGATYYVYIDANTGEQANILKIVETDNGDLLM